MAELAVCLLVAAAAYSYFCHQLECAAADELHSVGPTPLAAYLATAMAVDLRTNNISTIRTSITRAIVAFPSASPYRVVRFEADICAVRPIAAVPDPADTVQVLADAVPTTLAADIVLDYSALQDSHYFANLLRTWKGGVIN